MNREETLLFERWKYKNKTQGGWIYKLSFISVEARVEATWFDTKLQQNVKRNYFQSQPATLPD